MTTLRNPESGRYQSTPPKNGGGGLAFLTLLLGATGGFIFGAGYMIQNPPEGPPVVVSAPACPAPIIAGRVIPDEDWKALRTSVDLTQAALLETTSAVRDALKVEDGNDPEAATKEDADKILGSINVARRHIWQLMNRPVPTCKAPKPAPVVHRPAKRHGPHQHCPFKHEQNYSTWQ